MHSTPDASIPHSPPGTLVLFKIISRRSWDELCAWHRALPGSRIEHVMKEIYVLQVPAGGAQRIVR